MALDFLKSIFGDKALTMAEFETAVDAAKLDIADLASGNYVAKSKHDRIATERDTAKQAVTDLTTQLKEAQEKGTGDETLKKALKKAEDDLAAANKNLGDATAKLTKRDRLDAAAKEVGGDVRLAKLLTMEASELVTEDVDFETAMAKIIKDNKDVYTVKAADGNDEGTTVKTAGNSNQDTKKTAGDSVDAGMLKAFGLPENTEIPKA